MFTERKNLAFTLSEVLITLGLLGSIAAITLPNLAFNYRGKVLEQQFRSTYSEIKTVASELNDQYGDWATYANGKAYGNWYRTFMSHFNGGSKHGTETVFCADIDKKLKEVYNAPNAKNGTYAFSITNGLVGTTAVCDNGEVWLDSKGRIWTFNIENSMICVDVNGVTKPNRLNVDIFAFIPMSPEMVATWIYDDPEHPNKYTGTIIPCDLSEITKKGKSNTKPSKTIQTGETVARYHKGSGSALDYCPFFEPLENVAPMDVGNDGTRGTTGTSAKGKKLTRQNNYWQDYIDYK